MRDNGLMDGNEVLRIANRYVAIIMTDLEEANCPAVYKIAVKSLLIRMRSDLTVLNRHPYVHKENRHGY